MKTKNPGWQPGNYWVVCDRCGLDYRVLDVREEWTGLVVCDECWEPRHERDFVRGVEDDPSPKGPVRPEQTDDFISVTYAEPKQTIPSGTNDNGD